MPVTIFFCYAREDEALLNKLKAHLRPLQRQSLIDVWYDRDISAGTEWEQEISKHLDAAKIILLLVSPDFMNSDYCSSIEMKRAVERHERKEARVIPVILDHVYWQVDPLNKLQALPTDAKPVMSAGWHSLNEALFNVVEGIRSVVEQLTEKHASVLPIVAEAMQPKVSRASSIPPIAEPVRKISPLIAPLAVEKLALRCVLAGHAGEVKSVAMSADGQTLVSGSADRTIKVWNLFTGEEVRTFKGHVDAVWSVAISADGQTLVSASEDKTVKVWNLSADTELYTLVGHTGPVHCVAMSADGQTLVSGSTDHTIKVWNLSSGKEMRSLTGYTMPVTCLAMSADGQTLVSGSEDCMIKVRNPSTGQAVRIFTGHTGTVWSVAISADGQTLVSASEDKTVKVWNLSADTELYTRHTGSVDCVAISANGQTLISGSRQGWTIRVWNLSNGKEIHTLLDPKAYNVTSVAISADGQTLISVSRDKTIKVWGA
jgi:WD40 repeat protein